MKQQRRQVSDSDDETNGVCARPIFIVGCERSGTTLLRAMLNAHPHIAIPYESGRFSRLAGDPEPWGRVWNRSQVEHPIQRFLAFRKVQYWSLDKKAVFDELDGRESFRYADILRAIYSAYAKQEGKRRWGDKTPGNTFEILHLSGAFPDAQFIHIVRDGRDVYLSWSKVDWARYDVRTAAKKWSRWVRTAFQVGERLGPRRYYALRYEDLILDPSQTLREICEFLGESFSASMLRYYEEHDGLLPEVDRSFHKLLTTPPDRSRVFAWKREMAQGEVKAFEKVAGWTLLKYGYEVTGAERVRAHVGIGLQHMRQRLGA